MLNIFRAWGPAVLVRGLIEVYLGSYYQHSATNASESMKNSNL